MQTWKLKPPPTSGTLKTVSLTQQSSNRTAPSTTLLNTTQRASALKKTNAAGAKTIYLYEGKEVLLELDVNGNQTAKNIYGVKRLKRNVTGKDQYYLCNAHGDVTALVDRNGNVSGRYDYDAFGNLTEEVDGVGNPYKYAGEEHDSETGLYNLKGRYYSPKTARFVSEDSYRGRYADPLSLNLYT